jgi:inner membrane transporter RhtA
MMLGNSLSNQTGAAVGATAFPVMGPVGVVAVRQFVTALVLMPLARPRLWRLDRAGWWPILGLALVFGVMNLTLYTAVDRIGLGLAVTLEFLGPLGVAVAGSRRLPDLLCAGLAALGVVVLTDPGPTTDVLGIGVGLVSALAWAAYILLNRTLGTAASGVQGPVVASMVSGIVWIPVALVWFGSHPPTIRALAAAAVCGVLSSVVPYVTDLIILRRVPAAMFGTLTSVNPVWAALLGWVVLDQALRLNEWAGIALIVVSNALISMRGLRPREAGRRRRAESRRAEI